jgi:acetyl/propionyl-CoA carboxylase alpha subunit
VRVDGAVASGSVVSTYYDPMIAKLVVFGATRAEAIGRMRRALAETVLLGIETNLGLHRRILAEPDFVAGAAVTTRYIERHPAVTRPGEEIPEAWRGLIAAAASAAAARARDDAPAPTRSHAWRRSATWRS